MPAAKSSSTLPRVVVTPLAASTRAAMAGLKAEGVDHLMLLQVTFTDASMPSAFSHSTASVMSCCIAPMPHSLLPAFP